MEIGLALLIVVDIFGFLNVIYLLYQILDELKNYEIVEEDDTDSTT